MRRIHYAATSVLKTGVEDEEGDTVRKNDTTAARFYFEMCWLSGVQPVFCAIVMLADVENVHGKPIAADDTRLLILQMAFRAFVWVAFNVWGWGAGVVSERTHMLANENAQDSYGGTRSVSTTGEERSLFRVCACLNVFKQMFKRGKSIALPF